MTNAVRKEPDYISVEDYLEEEKTAEERHEYVDGRVFAMAGASEPHEIVAGNLFAAILNHIRGRGCRVFKGDMKVRLHLNAQDLFYYPDVMVVCDKKDTERNYKTRPKVIVEVMTEYKSDHVEKLFAYQQIETLEEYLIIDQDPENPRAWIYRRENGWQKEDGAPEGRVDLASIDFQCPLQDLYIMD